MKRVIPLISALGLLSLAGCSRGPAGAGIAALDQAIRANPAATRVKGTSCELFREGDELSGIEHARAVPSTELGAILCLGYLHGRDRAWQMDYLRRTFEGRKAEVQGHEEIRSDFVMRMMGFSERAEKLASGLDPADRERLNAYSLGVNRGFEDAIRAGVYEFREWRYLPEPWKPADTLGLMLLEAFDQTRRSFERDLDEAAWLKIHGSGAANLFSSDGLPWDTSVLKRGEYEARPEKGASLTPKPAPETIAGLRDALRDWPALEAGLGEGSNNWALAPARSATGHAWLANDPHLPLKHPSFWHWDQVEGGGIDVIGASVPGIPVVVSGANEHVAWGLTNSYLDVADVDLVPEGELKAGAATSFRPTIWVRAFSGAGFELPFVFKTFRRTKQGWPILPIPAPRGYAAVLRWSGFDLEPGDLGAFLDLMKAGSVAEMDSALKRVGIPSWNFVFADDQGGIGYRVVGKVPRRTGPPAFGTPVAHLSRLQPWTYLSAEELPHLLNPGRGYIATANNRQWPSDSMLDGGRAYANGFRAFRIEELLKASPKQDEKSISRIQCDVLETDARFILPKLTHVLDEHARAKLPSGRSWGERENLLQSTLESWDFRAGLDCVACAPYHRFMDLTLSKLGVDRVGLYHLLENPAQGLWAKYPEEVPNQILSAYFQALDDLGLQAGHALPQWGDLHVNFFEHLSADPRWAVAPISTPGDQETVDPGTSTWSGGENPRYVQEAGASQRLIVELSRPPKIYSVLGGSEIDVEKPDLNAPDGPWRRWRDCGLDRREFPVDWARAKVERVGF